MLSPGVSKNFFVRSQVVNPVCFVGYPVCFTIWLLPLSFVVILSAYMVSIATMQLCCCSEKTMIRSQKSVMMAEYK